MTTTLFRRKVFLSLPIGLLLLACNLREKPAPPRADECVFIAKAFVESIAEGDVEYFDIMFDRAALVSRATRGMKLSRDERRGLIAGSDSLVSIAHQLVELVDAGGSYKLLQLHEVDGEPRVLIRLVAPTGGLSYHDLVFMRNPVTGEVIIGDIYLFNTGELLSTTLRRNIIDRMEETSDDVERDAEDDDYAALLRTVSKMRSLSQQGRHEQAIALYRKLPYRQQRQKLAVLAYTEIASNLGDDEYMKAINTCAREFPHEPSTLIFLLDKYALMKRHDALLATIDRLDSLVDGDPYLDYLRGIQYHVTDKLDSARRYYKNAIYYEPLLEQAYLPMIDLLIAQKDFQQATVYLAGLLNRFDNEFEHLDALLHFEAENGNKEYAAFLASHEYEQWMEQFKPVTMHGS